MKSKKSQTKPKVFKKFPPKKKNHKAAPKHDDESDMEEDNKEMLSSSEESDLGDNLYSSEGEDSLQDFKVEEDASDDEELFKKTEKPEGSDEGTDDEWLNADMDHKESLKNLRKIDPEFYQFLEENDKKLLDFDVSDDEDDVDENEDDDEKYHKPPKELEVGSDESDYENEEGVKRNDRAVTLAFVKQCRENLMNNPVAESIRKAIELFHAALDRVSGEGSSKYVVEGSAVFNAIMEMCVMCLHKAIVEFLKVPPQHAKDPTKSKRWSKVKAILQSYFNDLLKILDGVASQHVVSVMLKHLHSMCSYVACFPKLSRSAIKRLTELWSTGEDSVRVLAFLCILRLTTVVSKSSLLNAALKNMYIAYIRGSKFVSMNSLPPINFMKQTLVTLMTINPSLSYQHAFLYIRQLAIHLRNAVTIHKKETFQTVYNWQYIHSLRLWVDLMCATPDSAELQQLLYPLVQIILGCIKLIPTAQYLPLRFHCIQMLIKIAKEIGTYSPIIALIMEALTSTDFNRKFNKATMKPFDLTFVLRLSKSAMMETGFTDSVVEKVAEQLLETCFCFSHSITFPDLVVPAIVQLKNFLKECKTPKYSSKLKLVLLKIEENYKYINNERNRLDINLKDANKINAWELDIKAKGTPLKKFWEQYMKTQNLIKNKKMSEENARLCDIGLPKIKRPKLENNRIRTDSDGQVELFPSSDESDMELAVEPEEEISVKRTKIKNKKSKPDTIVEDIVKSEEESDADEPDDVVGELNLQEF